jgi:hypothetical protein
MNIEIYQKLKGDVVGKGFYYSYKGFMSFMYYSSFVSNALCILFAYFHLNKIVEQAVESDSTVVNVIALTICILILVGLEYFKRFLFDKFSVLLIGKNYGAEISILGACSTVLIAASFYLSLHGASEYAAKSDEIKANTEQVVEAQQDTLSATFDKKIATLEQSNTELSKLKLDYDTRAESSTSNKDKNYYRNQVKEQQALIDKNDEKIKELKKERDDEIAKATTKITSKADEKMESNSQNATKFLVFSTFIEFLILFGIHFKNFFIHKSVSDYEEKIKKDPRYKNLLSYNHLVDTIIKPDSSIGDAIPFKTEIIKILKLNQVDLVGKELDDAMKVLAHLGILQQRGAKKYLKMDKDSAKDAIKTYLKID